MMTHPPHISAFVRRNLANTINLYDLQSCLTLVCIAALTARIYPLREDPDAISTITVAGEKFWSLGTSYITQVQRKS